MPVDFLTLVRRDHTDLHRELTALLDPDASSRDLRAGLDGVRLGLTAHAEAEDVVLGQLAGLPGLRLVVAHARRAHLAQEGALAALVAAAPQTRAWRLRAQHLRDLVECHAAHVDRQLAPALRTHAPAAAYDRLAAEFATERLRQLAMLSPSGPVLAIPRPRP